MHLCKNKTFAEVQKQLQKVLFKNGKGLWNLEGGWNTQGDGVMNNNQQNGMDLIQLNFLLNI